MDYISEIMERVKPDSNTEIKYILLQPTTFEVFKWPLTLILVLHCTHEITNDSIPEWRKMYHTLWLQWRESQTRIVSPKNFIPWDTEINLPTTTLARLGLKKLLVTLPPPQATQNLRELAHLSKTPLKSGWTGMSRTQTPGHAQRASILKILFE